MADTGITEIQTIRGDVMTCFEPGMLVISAPPNPTRTWRLRMWLAAKLFSWARRLNLG